MTEKYDQICDRFPAVKRDVLLEGYSTFGIGGTADLFYPMMDMTELQSLVEYANRLQVPYLVIGSGSNTIFADQGFRGLIIHTEARGLSIENGLLAAECGALLSQVIQFSLKNNLSGIEKLMGIPGTIGGAVRGNAGAYGVEISNVFDHALLYSPAKGLFEADSSYFQFNYRYSKIKESRDIILKVWLKLQSGGDHSEALKEATEIVKNRISKQPKGKCCGSFFKNPSTELTAGYLLDQAGCRGLQVGGAQVSLEHANWIINLSNATFSDVSSLASMMKQRVKQRFEIELFPEVQLIGTNL